MGREIKFRVWHKPEKKMHSYLKAKFGTATNITLEGKFKDVEQVTTKTVPNGDLEVMQYTGLQDKNGTEIYEGDILGGSMTTAFGPSVVEWAGEFPGFHRRWPLDKNESSYFSAHYIAEEGIEVLGNIYENPELVTSQNT